MSEPVIEVRHLSKSFGTHVVLRDVDFTVNPGDVTCIIGASGSGKSTLLRCINLLETPTHGSVLFHGQDITAKGSDPCAYRAKVGMVFQSFNLFNNMTVLDNCTAGLRYVLHMDIPRNIIHVANCAVCAFKFGNGVWELGEWNETGSVKL